MMDDSNVIFHERLPKYVTSGTRLTKKGIIVNQIIVRLITLIFIIASIQSIFSTSNNELGLIIAIPLIWIACLIFIYISEYELQSQLDGYTAIIITKHSISIPPRFLLNLIGRPKSITYGDIRHIEIERRRCRQWIDKKKAIFWYDSPTELIIVTNKGKKYRSGPKPPSTIIELKDVLRKNWHINLIDNDLGNGRGKMYSNGKILWEHPYEEIIKMNLFQWQD
jgi:hypothetical protein